MTRVSQAEYLAAYRIFNYVDKINGGYYGQITLDRIYKLVSQNRWIVIPRKGLDTIEEAKSAPVPNIYLSFEEVIEDEKGRANCDVGITFHNVDAMVIIREALRRKTISERLIGNLQKFDDTWDISFWHKISTHSPNSTPYYERSSDIFNPSGVIRQDLIEGLEQSDLNRPQRGDIYPRTGTEVLGSSSIFSISKYITIADFDKNIINLCNVFRIW